MRLTSIAILSASVLVGCAATKGGYYIKESSADRIVVGYEASIVSQAMMQQAISEHCAAYNKVPKLIDAQTGYGIVYNSETYACVQK